MKPKTRVHREVLGLKNKLPKITSEQTEWAYKKLFKFYAWKTKHKAACFECGHEWQVETNMIAKLFGVDCPKCGKTLIVTETKSWSKEEKDYFQIMTTCEGFQVIRMFQIHHYCKKGYKAHYSCFEIYQHWISPKGKLVILAIGVNSMGLSYSEHSQWRYGTPMEIRKEHNRYFINNAITYPRKKICPLFRRNGFRGNLHEFNFSYFISLLLSNPMAETLLKTGQIPMLKMFDRRELRIKNYWQSIKICIRNKYLIKEPDMWFDHLFLLEYFHKDIHNKKYICPYNFHAEHQSLIKKKQAILDKEELEKLSDKIKIENILYTKNKGRFFDLNFTNGTISIVVLNHVKEFYTEGKALHHCIFSNEYYKKNDTLILSARKEDERLETLELSLKDFKIIQSRGACNQNTPYHEDIISLVNSNIDVIRKTSKKRKLAIAS